MKQIIIKIKGMHCKSCETLIKDSLEELEDVKVLDISGKKGLATIEYNESLTSLSKIKDIIKQEGYKI